jgi:DNA polymerase
LDALVLPGFERPALPEPLRAATTGSFRPFVPAQAAELHAHLPQDLPSLRELIRDCRQCTLCKTRTQTVFADGKPTARLLLVGEAPGRDEDLQGLPFVGRAGQLLNKMLAAIQLNRKDVYICNVLKCRPPDNRTPMPDEVEKCSPYLEQQIALVKPVLIGAPRALGGAGAPQDEGLDGLDARETVRVPWAFRSSRRITRPRSSAILA